jgi:hypothetical protein
MPTFFLIVFKMKKWAIAKIDKYRRAFLWRGHDVDNVKGGGGHCLVNWQQCMRPKKLGGLGIKDLKIQQSIENEVFMAQMGLKR